MDGNTIEYCVKGNELTLKVPGTDSDDETSFWVLDRK